jgi:predicted O-methyltransferase YrrM
MCSTDPGEPGRLCKKRWSVNKDEARILSELFRGLTILEIGTGLGISTNKMAETAKMVYTVDVDPWVEKEVAPTLAKNVVFVNNLSKVIGRFDAAFIDGLHTYNQCMEDIADVKTMVKHGGLIVLHDSRMMAIRNAVIDSKLDGYEIQTQAGMVLTWND